MSPDRSVWTEPLVIERHRNGRQRKYVVSVLPLENAVAVKPPTSAHKQKARSLQSPPPTVTKYVVSVGSKQDAHVGHLADDKTAVKHVADLGARPISRAGAGLWPVLKATGVRADSERQGQEREQDALERRMTTLQTQASEEAAAVASITRNFAPLMQRRPFLTGMRRPRLLERRPAPLCPYEEFNWRNLMRVPINLAEIRAQTGKRRSPAKKAKLLQIKDENDISIKIRPSPAQAAVIRKERQAKMRRANKVVRERVLRGEKLAEIRKQRRPTAGFHRGRLSLDRDVIRTNDDIERLLAAFKINFADTDTFCSQLAFEALEDFGIEATSLEQRDEVMKSFEVARDKHPFVFEDFCAQVADARRRMRQWWRPAVYQIWQKLDTANENINMLHTSKLTSLLADCGFSIDSIEHELLVEVMIEELNQDERGHVSYEEAEYLVQQVREVHHAQRRQAELDIREKYQLRSQDFKRLRPQIIWLVEEFHAVDPENRGDISIADIMELLESFGLMHEIWDRSFQAKLASVRDYIEYNLGAFEKNIGSLNGVVDFNAFIQMICELQQQMFEQACEDLTSDHSFETEDDDCFSLSGLLDFLHGLGLSPKNAEEQTELGQVLRQVSRDSRWYSFDVAVSAALRVSEVIGRSSYRWLLKKASEIGLDRQMYRNLRNVFEELLTELEPRQFLQIGPSQIEYALNVFGASLPLQRLQEIMDCESLRCRASTENWVPGFIAFMQIMRLALDELAAVDPGEEDARDTVKSG